MTEKEIYLVLLRSQKVTACSDTVRVTLELIGAQVVRDILGCCCKVGFALAERRCADRELDSYAVAVTRSGQCWPCRDMDRYVLWTT